MNRTVLALGMAAVMLATTTSRVGAQQAPPTRVAIVNIGLVFTKYDKAKAYKDQMKKLIDPYALEGETLKKQALSWQAAMKDPKFDPSQRAFYYARVIEIPTPRWTAYDAKHFGIKMGRQVPLTAQQRAYTSPIWYTPAN